MSQSDAESSVAAGSEIREEESSPSGPDQSRFDSFSLNPKNPEGRIQIDNKSPPFEVGHL